MESLQAVIFDIDGTLVDSNDAHAKAFERAFAQNGLVIPYARLRSLIGMGGDKLIPTAAGFAKDSAPGERVSATKKRLFEADYLPHLHAFHHARALLERLSDAGYRLATATSAEAPELAGLLEAGGLADCFASWTSSSDAQRSKPDADIVLAALERLHLAPSEALMVGDTPYDLAAATRAGVGFVGFRCGGWGDRDFEGAIALYDGPADLLARFDRSPFARGDRAANRR